MIIAKAPGGSTRGFSVFSAPDEISSTVRPSVSPLFIGASVVTGRNFTGGTEIRPPLDFIAMLMISVLRSIGRQRFRQRL